jgi:cell division protein FtsZ
MDPIDTAYTTDIPRLEVTPGPERVNQPRLDSAATGQDGPEGVARLVAVGVGGGGSNAINHMIEADIHGIEFIAMNTDAQALRLSRASKRIRIGQQVTRGLGAGGNPEIGRRAAEESYEAIQTELAGADMVFITAGMGGGTGTGASPLVVAIVTTPFGFERQRKRVAERGVTALRDIVDAVIVVSNERLMTLAGHDMSLFEAYRLADDVLRQGIQGITDLITIPGLINLDFADIRAIMANAGSALMTVGQASGEHRAEEAARRAITNSLLETDITGARGVIFNITGGDDLTLNEVNRIADIVSGAAHQDANIIYGTVYDPNVKETLNVTVVATGFEPRVRYDRERAASANPFVIRQRQSQPLGQVAQPERDTTSRSAVPPAAPPIRVGAPLTGNPQAQPVPASLETIMASDQPDAPSYATVRAQHAHRGYQANGAENRPEDSQGPRHLGYFGDDYAATDAADNTDSQEQHHHRRGLDRFFSHRSE